MRIRHNAICQECGNEIKEDLCIVLNERLAFDTCICDRCRDRFKKKNRGYLGDVLVEMMEEMTRETPYQEYDIISTKFARCLA